jgi:hypothetical protein
VSSGDLARKLVLDVLDDWKGAERGEQKQRARVKLGVALQSYVEEATFGTENTAIPAALRFKKSPRFICSVPFNSTLSPVSSRFQ